MPVSSSVLWIPVTSGEHKPQPVELREISTGGFCVIADRELAVGSVGTLGFQGQAKHGLRWLPWAHVAHNVSQPEKRFWVECVWMGMLLREHVQAIGKACALSACTGVPCKAISQFPLLTEVENMSKTPGSKLAHRPVHFIWITDCSASMAVEGKIQALNTAIREAIPDMREVAKENPNAEVLVRAIKFSSGAHWHISQPTPVQDFTWTDLTAEGVTDMGKALTMVAEQLKMPPMTDQGLPPVLALISDGEPTDDFSAGLKALMGQRWGQKAVRVAIAIGTQASDASAQEVFQKFIGNPELKPFQANNPEALARAIRWTSTVLKAATSPNSQVDISSRSRSSVPIPQQPADSLPSDPPAVW